MINSSYENVNNLFFNYLQVLTLSQHSIASTQRSTTSPSERSAASSPQRPTTSLSERSVASSSQRSTASPWHRSTTFSFQQSMPSDSDSEILSPPSTCFIRIKKPVKRQKIEPIESAFSQINTTLNTMAMQIYSKRNSTSDNIDDPDVLIGKLVTTEFKKDS